MKFTDIKPNPKDYSREDIVKAFQDRYHYTGQLTKLIQTPVKIPYSPFRKEPYFIFDPTIQTVTEESINYILDNENISDSTIQDIVCNTSYPIFDTLIEHLNNHYLKEQLGNAYEYLKFFQYPYVQDALANLIIRDQKPLTTRFSYVRFNSVINDHIHIFSQKHIFDISPSKSDMVIEYTNDKYVIKTQYDSLIAINDAVVNTLIPDLKKDLETIKEYVDNHPKQLTKTVTITPIPEDCHDYIKTINKLDVSFPTSKYEHDPAWLINRKGFPKIISLDITLAIKDDQLTITHDFEPEESLQPFNQLTIATSKAKRNIDQQLQDVCKAAYFQDQCDIINQNKTLSTFLNDLETTIMFKEGEDSYRLSVEYTPCTKIINYHKSGPRLLTLQRDRDYGKRWDIILRKENATFDQVREIIETFKSLF